MEARIKMAGRIAGLDLIRFFAALLVLMFHFRTGFWAIPGVERGSNLQENPFLVNAWVGVEIFFVLSGLVIAQSANGKSALQFFRGRLGRLMPTVWICATVAAILVACFEPTEGLISSYLRTIVLYPHGPWINGIYWTLALEATFYAVIFVLLAAKCFRYEEQLAFLLGGASSIYLFAVAFLGLRILPQHLLLQHGCFFALGISLWLVQVRGKSFPLFALILVTTVAGIIEIGYIAHGRLEPLWFVVAAMLWLASVAAMGVTLIYPKKGNNFTETLGLMTYPLYLIHLPLGPIIIRMSPAIGRWPALILATIISLAAAWIAVKIEPYIRKLLMQSFDRLVSFEGRILFAHRR